MSSQNVLQTVKINVLPLLLAFSLTFQACSPQLPDNQWDYSDIDIVGTSYPTSSSIDIDVYIDATASMEGFALSDTTMYSQFLDQLELKAKAAWKNANIEYFKFGSKIRQIDRSTFLQAKEDTNFYKEVGIFEKTYIDSVITRTNPNRLSVLVTDLFQDNGDVTTMIEKFKKKCFSNGIMVGIIGKESNFTGTVYNAGPSKQYSLNTNKRPFYALVFGEPSNMERLFEALKELPPMADEKSLICSKAIVSSYQIALTKTTDSKFVNKKTSKVPIPNSFDFSMKKNGQDAKFNLKIDLDRNKRCADFNHENIEFVVFKKSITKPKMPPPDSTITEDIKIENIQRSGNSLTAIMTLNNNESVGNYSYNIYVKTNDLKGLVVPPWISSFSTPNPTPGTPSAAKTYNLEKFIENLFVAQSAVQPIYISKFYVNIYKR